jgi:hypothetical protein
MYLQRLRQTLLILLTLFVSTSLTNAQESYVDKNYTPKRINKCIELFEAGQPVYYKNTKTTGI